MYIDTDIIYALIDKKDRHNLLAEEIMKANEKKYSSTATLIELEFVIKRELSNDLSKNILELVKNFNIEFKALDRITFEKSLELRKKYDLSIMDSLHVAYALLNDRRIASTDESFDIVIGLKRIA